MKKILRSLTALLMAAVLMLPAFGALAAEKPLTIALDKELVLAENEKKPALTTKINATVSGEISFSLIDKSRNTVILTEKRTGIAAGDSLRWDIPFDAEGLSASKPYKRMRASFLMDEKTYSLDFFFNYMKKDGKWVIAVEKPVWYPNNTACSFGPQFREVRPQLTDKWYMFTPIDLSIQGRQEFDYVAGNVYVIGKVYVDVLGDTVMVTYHNYYADQGGNTETKSEFFTFFPDLSSVTNVEPETMQDQGFAFGTPISIANDLGGDTNVLLFVRNRVNYRDYVTNSRKLTRFWINHPDRVALREAMLEQMD